MDLGDELIAMLSGTMAIDPAMGSVTRSEFAGPHMKCDCDGGYVKVAQIRKGARRTVRRCESCFGTGTVKPR